jgi:hypothetical protein
VRARQGKDVRGEKEGRRFFFELDSGRAWEVRSPREQEAPL